MGGYNKQEEMKVVGSFFKKFRKHQYRDIAFINQDITNLNFVQYAEALRSETDSIGTRPCLVL